MPLITHCSTPHCPGYTDRPGAMCNDCQARLDACPNCGRHGQALQVTPATVVDVREEWLKHRNLRVTEKTLFVYVTERTAPPKEPLTVPKAEQPA